MSNWIKSGIPVVNITNFEVIWIVEKIIFKSKKIIVGDTEIRKNKIQGVQVKRVTDSGTEITLMHTKELIPLSVAQLGRSECYMFINREGKYKDY